MVGNCLFTSALYVLVAGLSMQSFFEWANEFLKRLLLIIVLNFSHQVLCNFHNSPILYPKAWDINKNKEK